MDLTDQEAREMMFGDEEIEGEETGDLQDTDKDSSVLQNEKIETDDVDFENDEEIKELKKQSPKLDSAFAKLRKEKEEILKQKEEILKAKEATDIKLKQFDGYVSEKYKADYNLENTDQFIDYMLNQKEGEQQEVYEDMKKDFVETHDIDPKVFEAIIENNPDIIKSREAIKKFEEREQLERLEKNYESSFKGLQEKYPKFQKVEDINKILGPKSEEFWNLFKNNNLTMLQAYKLVDEDNLIDNTKKKAEQNTLNKINGKSHLKPTRLSADIDYTEVDQEELAWYEGLMGNKWTHQQMIEHSKANRR